MEKDKEMAVSAAVNEKSVEIKELQARLAAFENEKKLAVNEIVLQKEQALAEKNQELLKLTSQVEASEKESKIREQSIKDGYEEKLKMKEDQIAYYRDLKAEGLSREEIVAKLLARCNELGRMQFDIPAGVTEYYVGESTDEMDLEVAVAETNGINA